MLTIFFGCFTAEVIIMKMKYFSFSFLVPLIWYIFILIGNVLKIFVMIKRWDKAKMTEFSTLGKQIDYSSVFWRKIIWRALSFSQTCLYILAIVYWLINSSFDGSLTICFTSIPLFVNIALQLLKIFARVQNRFGWVKILVALPF